MYVGMHVYSVGRCVLYLIVCTYSSFMCTRKSYMCHIMENSNTVETHYG